MSKYAEASADVTNAMMDRTMNRGVREGMPLPKPQDEVDANYAKAQERLKAADAKVKSSGFSYMNIAGIAGIGGVIGAGMGFAEKRRRKKEEEAARGDKGKA